MQEMTAEVGENDFNVIKSIFEKYHFLRALGLKTLAATTVKMQISPLESMPIDEHANVMKIEQTLEEKAIEENANVMEHSIPVKLESISPTKNSMINVKEAEKIPEATVEINSMPKELGPYVHHVYYPTVNSINENGSTCGLNPPIYEWLVPANDIIQNQEIDYENSNVSEQNVESPTTPAAKKLNSNGRNTGLNGNYWSPTPRCIKRKSSIKDVIRSFKSCAVCKFNGTKKVMIKCDQCFKWFHRKCARVSNDPKYKELYFCNTCQHMAKKEEEKCLVENAVKEKYELVPKLYKGCPCGNSKTNSFMIGCDGCQRWFHGRCVKITKKKSMMIDKYYCGQCIVKNLKFRITSNI